MTNPFEHPDVTAISKEAFNAIVCESDRGALLVGITVVDEQLTKLFEELLPAKLCSKTKKKELFGFYGSFGSLSAKINIAFACRLLGEPIYSAVHLLRKLRNDAAHSLVDFRLEDHHDQLWSAMESIGTGAAGALNRIAIEAIYANAVGRMKSRVPEEDLRKIGIEAPEDFLDYISKNQELLDSLEERLYRWMLAYAVLLICGVMALRRDALTAEGKLIGLGKDSNGSAPAPSASQESCEP